MKVEVSAEAQAQIDRIDAWWRENRPAAPDLFAEEFMAALSALADTPAMGVRYAPRPSVRRLLLRRAHHHVYVTDDGTTVYVVAVWNAYRGCGPRL